MINKAEVIELYLSNKIETEKLLKLMKDIDTDDPEFQENLENIQNHIALIDIIIDRINQDPTQEDLNQLYIVALSWENNSFKLK